jgi:hypothetical protein
LFLDCSRTGEVEDAEAPEPASTDFPPAPAVETLIVLVAGAGSLIVAFGRRGGERIRGSKPDSRDGGTGQ